MWLTEFGASSLNFELVVWLNPEATKKPVAVTAAYNWALHSALQAHDIEVPFPQSDVHVRSLFGLTDEDARGALRLADVGERTGSGSGSAGDQSPAGPTSAAASGGRAGSDDASDNDAIDDVAADLTDRPQ